MSMQNAFDHLAKCPRTRACLKALGTVAGVKLRLAPPVLGARRRLCDPHGAPLCSLICNNGHGRIARANMCLHANRRFSRNLGYQVLECDAGLSHVAVPIMIGGEHVATIIGGQALSSPVGAATAAQLTKRLGSWGITVAPGEIRRVSDRTPVLSPAQLRSLGQLLVTVAQQLAERTAQTMAAGRNGEPAAVKTAKRWISEHLAEKIQTSTVARHTGLSEQYFCKLFHRVTGQTLTHYVAAQRVARAKTLLCDRSQRISDIAFASGFQSISQFNRVFKQHTRQSPAQYRASLDGR